MDIIHIYHTNDIHSHFENWPQMSRFLRDKRHECELANEAYYLFDVGDYVDRSNPLTEGTNGKGNILLLNEARYDAITIGNNEGITMSKDSLMTLYDKAEFDVILGNLTDENGEFPAWAVSSKIYTTAKGTKIGVIGATAQYTQFYSSLGWKISPPRAQLVDIAQSLVPQTDIIICLSHMGVHEDRLLAEGCSDIDVILGAHTHHLFPEGELVNDTLLAATGKYGDYTGHVTLEFDQLTNDLTHMNATLYPSNTLPVFDEDIEKFTALMDLSNIAMEEKLYYNPQLLKQNLFSSGSLSSFFGRVLIDYTNADCAIFNTGIFLGSLEAGWVTRKDIHALLPHPINICIVTLTGAELIEVYEQSLNEELSKIQVKGLGFRGNIMGAIIHERLYKNKRGILFAGNREVVPEESYTLATLDMFTFGFFFPLLQHAKKEYCMPDLIRDIFAQYGRQYNEVSTTPPEHNL